MDFDYAKLKGKIREKFTTQAYFANAIGLSPTSVSDKLNNKCSWTQSEIGRAADVLEIDKIDIPNYFFAEKVKVL